MVIALVVILFLFILLYLYTLGTISSIDSKIRDIKVMYQEMLQLQERTFKLIRHKKTQEVLEILNKDKN